jgi:hypothetical protein
LTNDDYAFFVSMSAKRKAQIIWCYCAEICGPSGVSRTPAEHLTHQLEVNQSTHPHVLGQSMQMANTSGVAPEALEPSLSQSHRAGFYMRRRRRIEESIASLTLQAQAIEAALRNLLQALTTSSTAQVSALHLNTSPVFQQVFADAQALREKAQDLPASYLSESGQELAHTVSRIFATFISFRPPGHIKYNTGQRILQSITTTID